MNAPQQSPLVVKVGDAIRETLVSGKLQPETAAQAALRACEFEEMRAALELLVYAKDMKDRAGDTPAYRAKKEEGWIRARAVLARLNTQQTEQTP